MRMFAQPRRPLAMSILLASASLLAACGGSSSSSDSADDHDHTDIESAGRLALYDSEASAIKVVDLDSGDVLSNTALSGAAPTLVASPGYRYAAAIQRADDRVSFLDGGLYTEDHGDHMHDYAETPSLLALTLNDHRPTHYSPGEEHGVVFFDGGDAARSKVTAFSDASLGNGDAVASLDLENSMHGVAKLIDGHLFVTYRDASITDTTLPAAVERYHLDGTRFEFETRYSEPCPKLHGAAANHHVLGFGCSDGVMVIDLQETDYPARKLANPEGLPEGARIGTLVANHDVDALVGIAGNQLFVINAESAAQPYTELDLGGSVGRVAQGFTTHGEVFYVLGDDGALRLFDPANGWALVSTVSVVEPLTEASAKPAVTPSASQDRLYVTDAPNRSVIEVDTTDGRVVRTLDVGFPASSLAWLGLTDTGHDHEHEH